MHVNGYAQLVHVPTGKVVASDLHVAGSLLSKAVGLLGRKELQAGEGICLPGVGSIHTLGMRFSIDVLFLDRNNMCVGMALSVPPQRLYVSAPHAAISIELRSEALGGSIFRIGDPWLLLKTSLR